jgi:hypothetical protein|tara:strand:- start:162 stop:410 length:249 start_codon:yes stop_codon:yes gene_type:complete
MVKSTIEIPENENRVLTILKGKYGFQNKEQVIISLIKKAEENLEPELRPEFIKEMKIIDKHGKYSKIFSSIEELDKHIKTNV